ncbi:hypothetical protein BDR26DRAFT_257625 [Obelidium mucronatum]|nr:hypothetical protein BDR26DRAFT_257625 [Obelidium mucronatum]
MSDLFKACEEHKHPPNRQNKHDPQLDSEFSEGYKRLKKDGLKIKVTESRTLSIVAPIYFSKPGSICSPSEAEFGSSKDLAENSPVSSPLMQKGYILFDFEYHETITDPAIQIIPLSTNELEFVQENRAELMKEIDRIVKLKDDKIVTAQQAELKIKQITENRYDGEELGLLMHDLPDVVTSRFDSGILRFKIYGAMNLSTPRSAFIDIHIDNESQFKTQVHEQSTTPSWNTTCDLCLCSFKSQKLTIYIMDNDQENANGSAKEGSKVAQWSGNLLDIIGKKRIWVKFEELENPASECGVYLSLGYLPIRESLSLALIETGILHINIEKAIDLEPIDDSGTSDPYCLVFLNDKPIHKTKTHSKELNPVFNESTSIEVKERLKSNLTIVVKDFNTTTRHVILGTIEVSLSDLGVEKWIQFERLLVGGRKGKLLFQLRFEHPGTVGQSMDGIHEKLSRIETVSTRQESLKRDVSNINSASKKVLEGTLGPKQLLSVGMCLDPEDENDLPPNSNEITTISSQTQSQKQLLQGETN